MSSNTVARQAVAGLVHQLYRLHVPTWTQADLAAALQQADVLMARRGIGVARISHDLRSVVRTISNWENGHRLPDEDSWVRLVIVAATREELEAGTIMSGSRLHSVIEAWERMRFPIHRRQALLGLAALAVLGRDTFSGKPGEQAAPDRLTWALTTGKVDLAAAHGAQDAMHQLLLREDSTPPALLLPGAHQHLGTVAYLYEQARDGLTRAALGVVLVQALTFAGWLHWEASGRQRRSLAERCYRQAISLARQGGQPWIEAYPRCCLGLVKLAGQQDPEAACEEFERAAALLGPGTSPARAARAGMLLAEARALLGQEAACQRALDAALDSIQRSDPSDPFHGVFDTGHAMAAAGICLVYLGRYREAEQALRELAGQPGTPPKLQAVLLAERSLALLRSGWPEEGARVLQQAARLAHSSRSAGGAQRARTAGQELAARWGREPWAAGALEELRGLGAARPRLLGTAERAA